MELAVMPTEFAAGTTVSLRLTYPDHKASDGWAATLFLAGKSVIDGGIEATADGDDHLVEIDADETEDWAPGIAYWSVIGERAGIKAQIDAGKVLITRNLATAEAGDAQSADEKELELVRAEIARRMGEEGGSIEAYTIEGQGVTLMSIEQLYAREKQLRKRLVRKRRPGMFDSIAVGRFGPPTGSA